MPVLRYVLLTILIASSLELRAEISTKDLPDIGNLAILIGTTNQGRDDSRVIDNKGKIASGLPVRDNYRGTTAREIAKYLSGGSIETETTLFNAIEKERVDFENFLTSANFKLNDMGVAYTACFIVLWELASNQTLSQEASLAAGKYLVSSFTGIAQEYKGIEESEKARAYDWLMTTPVAFASLVKGLEREGKKTEADMLRQKSAQLFIETFRLPYDYITISEKGDIGVDVEKIKAYQKKSGLTTKKKNNHSKNSHEKNNKIAGKKRHKKIAKIKALWTEPNKGLKPTQIEAITYYMNYRTSVYGVDVYYKEYLLLKDGWAYKSPTIPPSSFNAEASRTLEPDRWIRWRKSGGQYQLNISDEWNNLDGDAIKPAKNNQTVDAHLSFKKSWTLAGVAGGHSSKFMKLMKNGRFETSRYSLNLGQATDLVKYRSTDKEGSTTVGSGGGYKTISRSGDGASDSTGTYALNGYTIELRHDSGRVSQLLFGFTWGDEKYIYVDGTNYKNIYESN